MAESILNRRRIEDWLRETLVPVEPNPKFLRGLQARLRGLQRDQVLSTWMLALVAVASVVLLATWIGITVRLLIGLLGLLGIIERSRESKAAKADPVPVRSGKRGR